MTRRFALFAVALGLLFGPHTAWAANLDGGGSEVGSKTLTVDILKYGEFDLKGSSSLAMTVDAVQLAGGTNTTPVSDEFAFAAMANTKIDLNVPATINLVNGLKTLVADCEMDQFLQVDDVTVWDTAASLTALPSGVNEMILRVTVDPNEHGNTTTGTWNVELPAGAYTNTTALIITMTAN